MGGWHDPDLGRPIAAPLDRRAELLGVDLATAREPAANVEPDVVPTAPKRGAARCVSASCGPRRSADARGGYRDRRPTVEGQGLHDALLQPSGRHQHPTAPRH